MSTTVPKFSFAPGYTWQTEDADIVWVEITDYVLHKSWAQWLRGRSSETEQVRTATINLQLRNDDRRFDPMYSAGPYYGDLLPGVPLKVEGSVNGSDVQVFRGFIDGWPQEYSEAGLWSEVGITATDGLGKLALAKLPSSVYAIEVAADTPEDWWRLSETGGLVAGDSGSENLDGTYTPAPNSVAHPNPWETVSAQELGPDRWASYDNPISFSFPITVEALVVPADDASNAIAVFAMGDGTSTNERFATQIFNWGDGTFQVTEIVDDTAYYKQFSTAVQEGTAAHIVFDSDTPAIWVNGVDLGSLTSLGSNEYVVNGALIGKRVLSAAVPFVVADVARYNGTLSDARIEAHAAAFLTPWDGDAPGERADRILDLANWPDDLRDLATGFTVLGPAVLGGTALDHLRKLEASEQGRLFVSRDGKLTFHSRYYSQLVTAGSTSQVTFSDDGGASDIAYTSLGFDYDDRFVFGRIEASTSGGYTYTVENAASLTAYGDKTDTNLSSLDVDPATLRALAEHRLLTYKEPVLRPRPITVALHDSGISDTEAETLLELDLGMRVTIQRTPQGVGSAISQEAVIESISHRVNAKEWHVTFSLSPAPITDYGLWGDNWGTATWGP